MTSSRKLSAVLGWVPLGVAGLAALLVLFIIEENWRGERAWASCKRELEAKGERLDFAAFQPRPIPDQRNFFMAPMLSQALRLRTDSQQSRKFASETGLSNIRELSQYVGSKNFSAMRDRLKTAGLFSGPAMDSPAADVLGSMGRLKPLLDDVREAAQVRPEAAPPPQAVPFDDRDFNVSMVSGIGQSLAVRASVEIELGRTDEAYADSFALLRFANALVTNPRNLMNMMLGAVMDGRVEEVFSQGCQRHIWNDSRLSEFQKLNDRHHTLANLREAIAAERAQIIALIDLKPDFARYPTPSMMHQAYASGIFRGWVRQDEVVFCQRLDDEILSAFTVDPDRMSPNRLTDLSKLSERPHRFNFPYGILSGTLLQVLGQRLGPFGQTEDRQNLFSAACSIERFQLTHGRYPDSLGELVPTFLAAVPRGVFDGQPARYIKLPQGGHELYFIGQNGRDDGGKSADTVLKLPDAG